MSDKPKTIQEALAEVQRKVNEERARRVEEMNREIQEKNIEEGIGDLVKGGVQLAKNFGLGLKGHAVKGTPIPGRGAITSKATDMERKFNDAGKTVRNAAPKVAGTAAVGTAVGAATGKSGSASTPKAPETPKASAPVSTGPKASETPKTTKGGYFKSSPNVSKGDYTVKGGETLGAIAKKHGTSVGAIQSMNKGLTDANKIAKGAKLNLPTVKEDEDHIEEGWGDVAKGFPKALQAGVSNLGKGVNSVTGTMSSVGDAVKQGASSLVDKVKKVATGAGIGGAVGTAVGASSSDRANDFKDIPRTVIRQKGSPEAKAAATQLKADKKAKSVGASGDVMKPGGGSLPTQSKFHQSKVGNYDIKRGDTASAIAKRSGISLEKLKADNPHIKDINKISAGARLVVNKEEVESPIIHSFLDLMDTKSGNVFEAAKHLSAKQKKIASVAGDPDKIDAEDFKALRSKKVEEESKDYLGGSTITKDPKKYVDPSTPKTPYTGYKGGNAAGSVIDKAKGALDKKGVKEEVEEIVLEDFVEFHLEEGHDINDIVDFIEENYQLDEVSRGKLKKYMAKSLRDQQDREERLDSGHARKGDSKKHEKRQASRKLAGSKLGGNYIGSDDTPKVKSGGRGMKEDTEVTFSETELAYFEQVAKKSPNLRVGKGNEDERGIGDTVDSRDLTN